VTSCLRKIVTPGVQAVLPQHEGMRRRKSLQRGLDRTAEAFHVLVVFQNRHPLGVLMCLHAFESLEHLIARERQTLMRRVQIRENRAPNGVRMQNCAGAADPGHREVQERLGRGPAGTTAGASTARVDDHNVVDPDRAFWHRARGYGQRQRPASDNHAEVAAGPQHPPARVEISTNLAEFPGDRHSAGSHPGTIDRRETVAPFHIPNVPPH